MKQNMKDLTEHKNTGHNYYNFWRQLDMSATLSSDDVGLFPKQKKLKIENYEAIKMNLNKIKSLQNYNKLENKIL